MKQKHMSYKHYMMLREMNDKLSKKDIKKSFDKILNSDIVISITPTPQKDTIISSTPLPIINKCDKFIYYIKNMHQ